MITQQILDYLSTLLSIPFVWMPPLPLELTGAINWINDMGDYLTPILSKFGPVMPWVIFNQVVRAWIAALAFWVAMLGVRLLTWAIGR